MELTGLSEKATGCGEGISGEESPLPFVEGDKYTPLADGAPPTSFDWRSYQGSNWLTSIKNQGGCGSCWAFSAVGVAEAAHNIYSNDPNLDKDLSEQYLVSDCHNLSTYQTCCGGSKNLALGYIRDSGVPDEGCMPYVDGDGCSCEGGSCDSNCAYRLSGYCSDRTCSDRCGDWSSRLEYIGSMGSVSSDPQTIKQALIDKGPLAVSMGIGSAYIGYWDGDIYRCADDTSTNHAVIIVGYNDSGGYWLVRNSWGTGWGDSGYFKLGYGECRVEDYVYYADARIPSVGPLEYHSHTINDDTYGSSNGNGDGIVNCGEVIEIPVTLYNQGDDTATSVVATLSTSDSYITFTDSEEYYPDIPGGETGTSNYDYDFEVDPNTPDGHTIHIDLDITATNGGPWTDSFDVDVTCYPNHPPNTPSNPIPSNGATSVFTGTDLSWAGGDPDPDDTVIYDVYFGTSDPPTTLICGNGSHPICDPGDLSHERLYYWYVIATDNRGASITGPVWNFTTEAAVCNDLHEPNDTWDEATPIGYGTTLNDLDICPAGDVDYYAFTGNTDDVFIADIDAQAIGSSLDSYLTLYDTDGVSQLAYNDDEDGHDSYLQYTLPADGTYYLMVRDYHHPDEGAGGYFYTLSLTVSETVGPLVYNSHTVDDDTVNQSDGNGNGIVDCGEAIELYVDLYNQGNATALNVTATLTTTDPYVSAFLYNDASGYPDIMEDGGGRNTDDWDLEIDPDTPDGHLIHFDLDITADNGGPWTDSFDLAVTCDANNPPHTPDNPTPAAGATSVFTGTDLSWTGGDPDAGDTVIYDVYFGTSDPPTSTICDNVSSTSCDPGDLSYNTHYYWYVVATDNHEASITGPTWDFTTELTACNDPHEPNDTWDEATPIGYGTALSDLDICPAGDRDYYVFTGNAGEFVIADIDAQTIGSLLDPYLTLYDTDGVSLLAYNDDNDGLDSRLGYTLPTTGTYYLMVRDYDHPSKGGIDYFYTLTLSSPAFYKAKAYLPIVIRYGP
ncbi:MAG: C1 family peptidase [Anaerolineae bacterium]